MCKNNRHHYGNSYERVARAKLSIFNKTHGEYTLVSNYKGYSEDAIFKHNKCGTLYHSSVANVTARKGNCPNCLSERKRKANPRTKTTSQYVKEAMAVSNNEYEISGSYKNWNTKMLFKHNKCGNTFSMQANSFLQGRRCPKCQKNIGSAKRSKSDVEYRLEIKRLYRGEYTLLSKYINQSKYIIVKHNKCGHIWKTRPNNLLNGCGCPKCSESKGERLIRNYLLDNNIRFIPQYRFKDLKDKAQLSYDFKVGNILIEYQGIQHYKPIAWFNGNKGFSKQIKHDILKKEYAIKHNYVLVLIPYTVTTIFELDIILKKYIHGVKQGVSNQN